MYIVIEYIKPFLLFLCLICLLHRSQAQTLKGRLLLQNGQTIYGKEKPLSDVKVTLNGRMSVTNAGGFFEIEKKLQEELTFGLRLANYEWVNALAINGEAVCRKDNGLLVFYMGNARTVFSSYARIFQELNNEWIETQEKLLAAQENTPKASALEKHFGMEAVGAVDAVDLLTFFTEEAEPTLEYWAEKLAQIHLDGQTAAAIKAYQSLKSGKKNTLEKWLAQTSEDSDIKQDLELAWLLANAELGKAVQLSEKLVDRSPDDFIRKLELRHLYWLTRQERKLSMLDVELLNATCTEYQRFLLQSTFARAHLQDKAYADAKSALAIAYNLGKKLLEKQGTDEVKALFANLLLDKAFLEQSDSDKKTAEQYYTQAVQLLAELGQRHPYRYESDLLKAKLLLASFYFLEMDNAARAFPILNGALVIGQRLSRQYPQLYLDEIAVIYTWQGAFYSELSRPEQALEAYTLAARYLELLATQNGQYWKDAVNTNLLISQIYYEKLNKQQTTEAKDKGLSFVETATQQLEKLKIYDKEAWIEASNNLNFLRDAFSSWKP